MVLDEGTEDVKRARADSKDLAKAAKRDVKAMDKDGGNHGMNAECMKKYKATTKKILKKTNKDYDDFLSKIMTEFPK